MSKIQTRVFNFGNEKESSWPSRYGTNEGKGYHSYIDRETGEVKEGYPPPREVYDTAPIVMFDEMPTTYHEAAGRHISSRKEWNQADRETNSLTFGSREEIERTTKKGAQADKKAIQADRKQASRQAVQAWKENPVEQKQKAEKRAEAQYEQAKKAGLIGSIKKQIKETVK